MQLRGEIEGIDRATRAPAGTASVPPDTPMSYSFGLFSSLSSFSSAEQTVTDIVNSIHATLAKLAPVAIIETSSDGLTARSVINYTGRVASVWSNSSTVVAVLADAHMDSLQRAFALRAAFAGTIAAVGSTLVSISTAVAYPLSALRALASAMALKQSLDRLAAAVEASD